MQQIEGVKDFKRERIAVRCSNCGRILLFKMTGASGYVECKCTRCGCVLSVNLALRKKRRRASSNGACIFYA